MEHWDSRKDKVRQEENRKRMGQDENSRKDKGEQEGWDRKRRMGQEENRKIMEQEENRMRTLEHSTEKAPFRRERIRDRKGRE